MNIDYKYKKYKNKYLNHIMYGGSNVQNSLNHDILDSFNTTLTNLNTKIDNLSKNISQSIYSYIHISEERSKFKEQFNNYFIEGKILYESVKVEDKLIGDNYEKIYNYFNATTKKFYETDTEIKKIYDLSNLRQDMDKLETDIAAKIIQKSSLQEINSLKKILNPIKMHILELKQENEKQAAKRQAEAERQADVERQEAKNRIENQIHKTSENFIDLNTFIKNYIPDFEKHNLISSEKWNEKHALYKVRYNNAGKDIHEKKKVNYYAKFGTSYH